MISGNEQKKYSDNENSKDYYDGVINIQSLLKLKDGYDIGFTEEGFKQYQSNKGTKCTVVGIVGNKNKAKSYMLNKLSRIEMPIGHTITTQGISVNYPKEENLIRCNLHRHSRTRNTSSSQ